MIQVQVIQKAIATIMKSMPVLNFARWDEFPCGICVVGGRVCMGGVSCKGHTPACEAWIAEGILKCGAHDHGVKGLLCGCG